MEADDDAKRMKNRRRRSKHSPNAHTQPAPPPPPPRKPDDRSDNGPLQRHGSARGARRCLGTCACMTLFPNPNGNSPDPTSTARPSTQLARLQQQFVEGKHTDMVIRVRIEEQQPPAGKRQRVTRAAAADAPDGYTDIKAHSLVLRTHSPYFDKGLSGDWAEAAERRVELAVEDEQAVEDLKLLIKLSYSTSFTHDGGQLLPLDTRLRLAARADSLEFVEAVDQVVASLPLGLDFEGATTCLAAVPAALEEHAGMEAVRKQVAALLAKGIEERDADTSEESKVLAQRGVDALAKLLGPVHEMFDGAGTCSESAARRCCSCPSVSSSGCWRARPCSCSWRTKPTPSSPPGLSGHGKLGMASTSGPPFSKRWPRCCATTT